MVRDESVAQGSQLSRSMEEKSFFKGRCVIKEFRRSTRFISRVMSPLVSPWG
jgi:hypothetical protein